MLIGGRQGAGGGIGVPAHVPGAAVAIGGFDHHSGCAETFPGEIACFAGRGGHGNAGQGVFDGDGLGAGLGGAALRVGNGNCGVGQVQVAGGAICPSRYHAGGAVVVGGGDHHARGGEFLPVVVGDLAGWGRHRNGRQRPDGDGICAGLGHTVFRIRKGDRGISRSQRPRGGVCPPAHGFGAAVRHGCLDHGACGVETLPDVIGLFIRGCDHRNAGQLPHGHGLGGGQGAPCPLVGDCDCLGVGLHGFRGELAILGHVLGGAVRKRRRYH